MTELMVVVAIMAIIAGVTLPKYVGSLNRSKARDESNRLLAVVRYGQGMAALQRATYWLKINIEASSYSLERGAGRGDDFEATEDQLTAGGYSSGYSSGDAAPAVPADTTADAGTGEKVAGAGRTHAGRVEVFDETQHTLPLGVVLKKITDNQGTTYESGDFSIPLDPRGSSQDTTVYLGVKVEHNEIYSIHIGANGLTEVNVERAR